ncbi:MAG TPA: inositol monophosphatase [Candidatus Saccharimonadales bacterium]|nr:inositol monophosphatase [Candidatus Saccharimonadales bacterium]
MSYDAELAFAKELALEAGGIMQQYFRSEELNTTWKSDKTPLTVADTTINKLVIERVKAKFPEHGVLGEEESYEPDRDWVWVCDPIDGTVPFSVGIPASTFLLALVDRADGQPVAAVVYDPYLGHLYTATKGGGAFLNDQPLKGSATKHMSPGYVSIYGGAAKRDKIDYHPGQLLDDLRENGTRNISLASGAYTFVKIAEGTFLAGVIGEPGFAWDVAAPCLIVREAGGIVTDLAGSQRRFDENGFGCVFAANKSIHQQMLALIKGD